MIVINFKNYKSGREVVKLAKEIEKFLPRAIVAVPTASIGDVKRATKLIVYSQGVDAFEGKRGTGKITADSVKKEGSVGTLLNHSENKMSARELSVALKECKKVGLETIVFVGDLREARSVLMMGAKPDVVAYEDAKLVGSGKPITQYKGKEIEKFVKLIGKRKIKKLCGAGISGADDVRAAYLMGCDGVAVASAIVNAKKPGKILKEFSLL